MASTIEMENIRSDHNGDNQVQQNRPRFERMESREIRELRTIFDSLDLDKNGYISKNELKKFIKYHPGKLSKSLVKEIMKEGDTNSDGVLSFEEFCEMFDGYKVIFTRAIRRYCQIVSPTSYSESMSVWPPPLTILSFSFIQLVMFIVDLFLKSIHQESSDENTVINNATGIHNHTLEKYFIYNPHRRYEVWRFVTYMFVHSSWQHLLINLIFQICFGFILELVHRWWRVTLVYLAGILAASMANSIFEPDAGLNGASGGVYAIFTAHIATIIMNWNEMEYGVVQAFVFSVYFVTDFIYSTYHRICINDPSNSGYTAHMFGGIAGVLIGIGALRNLKELAWERRLWYYAVGLYFLLMTSGISIHIFFEKWFPPLDEASLFK